MMILQSVLYVLLGVLASAKPPFPDHVPNGRNVLVGGEPWVPLGHNSRVAPSGGNGLSPFGVNVKATLVDGFPNWAAVCDLNSDGELNPDGSQRTNGQELGDPNCVWRSQDDNDLLEQVVPTHPGLDESDPNFVPPSDEIPNALKIHAALMTLAWLFFAPVGIITAVVFKVKKQKKVDWFKIHRVCVGTAVYLTMVAYAVMVREKEQFLLNQTHTRAGHAVVLLAVIQPVTGFWRIHIGKDGSKSYIRLAWEYLHQWIGRLLVLAAAVAIFYGYDIGLFVDEGIRNIMKALDIIIFVGGTVFCIVWVVIRKDERKDPDLPLKKESEAEKKEPEPEVAKKNESGAASNQSSNTTEVTKASEAPEASTGGVQKA